MSSSEIPKTIIRPGKFWERLNLHELWATRELLIEMVRTDFRMRHRQTVVGILWTVLQPLLAVSVFSIVFGYFAKFPSDGVPYPLFVLSGYVVWLFFGRAIANSVAGLASNSTLIGKVYIPPAYFIIVPVATALVEALASMLILIVFFLYFAVVPPVQIVLFPLFIVMVVVTVMSFSLWLAPLNANLRDIQNVLPSLLQFWFFLTPVVYPVSLFPEALRPLSYLNPMTAAIEGARWSLLGTSPPSLLGLCISIVVTVALIVPGTMFFAGQTRVVADRI